jgi:hypothetical protein
MVPSLAPLSVDEAFVQKLRCREVRMSFRERLIPRIRLGMCDEIFKRADRRHVLARQYGSQIQ